MCNIVVQNVYHLLDSRSMSFASLCYITPDYPTFFSW